ncbi:unnamed protein product [Effrenium voratum]|nr:unnamed protein product [Effrenium voratum]
MQICPWETRILRIRFPQIPRPQRPWPRLRPGRPSSSPWACGLGCVVAACHRRQALKAVPTFHLSDTGWPSALEQHGVLVLRGVLSTEEIQELKDLLWQWLEGFGGGGRVSREDPTTWTMADGRWPTDNSSTGIVCVRGAGQALGAWKVRGHPVVQSIFSTIWGVEAAQLLTSMDGLILWRPWRLKPPQIRESWQTRGNWLHVDQNVSKRPELQAVQGIVSLCPANEKSGGFVCVPGSHKPEMQQLICEKLGGAPRLRKRGDFLAMPEDDLNCQPVGVAHEAGDMLLWDGRLIHGSEPGPGVEGEVLEEAGQPELLRMAVPVCMVPRDFADDEEQLAAWRAEAVARGITTKHWPQKQRVQGAPAGFVRSFRVDCLKSAIITFITQEIGGKFVDPPTFDIAKSYADSVNTTPLIFILSPGTDPVSDVIRFAEQVGMAKKFEPISLGQGQGPKAQKMIDSARQSGGWVLLSNCHLMQSWMPTLEAIVEQLDPENMSNNFRLWLTSMPAKSFPVQVLQNGVKMTNEPPSGLRANLLRSYTTVTDRLFEESEKPGVFKTLLFGFCFFHAVVQDRRKFGPIGWNIPYGFTPEDLAVCRQQLMLFVNKYKDVPYKVLNFLGAQINYGGRVTDDKDKLLISTILATYICPEAVTQTDGYKCATTAMQRMHKLSAGQDFVEYIRSLPLYPMPEAFGLHDNCNITCAQDEALKLLVGMQSMVSAGGGGGDGKSADDVMDATAASIQDKLDMCEQKFPTLYEAFRKAIKGLIVMTAELEELGKSVFVNEVPEMWAKKGPLSLKPLSSWFPDIIARVSFFQNWNDLGHTPPVHWISGIFFPQAFFTGAMQNYARKHGEEIDLLSFSQKVMDNVVNPKKDGVYIYGLYMEGGRFVL